MRSTPSKNHMQAIRPLHQWKKNRSLDRIGEVLGFDVERFSKNGLDLPVDGTAKC
jgi:hypothetical protein